jgi:hypothetical protein
MKFEEYYDGKKIVVDTNENGHGHTGGHANHPYLSIDNEEVHVMKDSYGKYSTHYLPYVQFESVLKLARALIDRVPIFKIKKGEHDD